MWKYIIIIIIAILVFSNLNPNTQSMILNWGKKAQNTAKNLVNVKGESVNNNEPYIDENNRTILGPVYQEVGCTNDLECQEWYDCSGCECDASIGKCWY